MQDKHWISRTTALIGEEKLNKLINSHVLVVGLGGIGSFAAEFIARAGVGEMTIVDGDVVDPSNRNRQLPALSSTHGVSKADWMAERLKDINPEIKLNVIKEFLSPEKAYEIVSLHNYDYIIDAIDSITPKINLLKAAYASKKKIVMSGGAVEDHDGRAEMRVLLRWKEEGHRWDGCCAIGSIAEKEDQVSASLEE